MKKNLLLVLTIIGFITVAIYAANSSVLTSQVERRTLEPHIFPVWERVVTFTVEADGGSTEMSHEVIVNGLLREMVIQVGAAGGISGTVDIDLDDNRDVEFDTNATLAELSETLVVFNLAVGKPVNNFTIRANPSDDPTTGQDDWTIVVACRGD